MQISTELPSLGYRKTSQIFWSPETYEKLPI